MFVSLLEGVNEAFGNAIQSIPNHLYREGKHCKERENHSLRTKLDL